MNIWDYEFKENYRNEKKCWYKDKCENFKEKCAKECDRFENMHKLLNKAGLTWKQQQKQNLVDNSSEAFKYLTNLNNDIDDWVREGGNICLMGSFGTGKTSWAIRMLCNYLDSVWEKGKYDRLGIFLGVPKFLNDCKDAISYRNDSLYDMRMDLYSAKLVVWDDIAAKKFSDFDLEIVFPILDYRINAGLANIFTSNLQQGEQLLIAIGPRLYDRICGNSIFVEIKGGSMRGHEA